MEGENEFLFLKNMLFYLKTLLIKVNRSCKASPNALLNAFHSCVVYKVSNFLDLPYCNLHFVIILIKRP